MKHTQERTRRWLLAALAALATALVAAGCGDNGDEAPAFEQSGQVEQVDDVYSFGAEKAEAGEANDPPWKVHFAQYWSGTPVLEEFRRVLVESARSDYPDIELTTSDAENKPTKLVSDIETAITRDVDAIIIEAGDGRTPVPAVERAAAAGIPVIAMQKRIDSDKVTTTVVADDVEQGRKQGEALVEELKRRNDGKAQGKVILVNGITGASLTVEQNRGFKEAIGKHPGIEVVCDQPGDFAREKAVGVLENCLQANRDADAVWYIGADVGAALAATLRRLGEDKDVFIVGGGGNAETLEVMKRDGPVAFDLVFPNCARPALEATRRTLMGEEVPKDVIIHAPGISSDNVADFLAEGDAYVDWPVRLPEGWQ